jgi:hypothetical protein
MDMPISIACKHTYGVAIWESRILARTLNYLLQSISAMESGSKKGPKMPVTALLKQELWIASVNTDAALDGWIRRCDVRCCHDSGQSPEGKKKVKA